MDSDTLVEAKIDDGHKLLARLARTGFDVAAAFWVKTGEEARWYLYIASNVVDLKGPAAAYRDVYGVLRSMADPWISVSEVKLISPNSPTARDLKAILPKHAGRLPLPPFGTRLGNVSIEDAYVYPQQTGQLTRDEVLQAVASRINRSGSLPPATVTLKNGSTITAMPIGVDVPHPGKVQLRFRDIATNKDLTYDADEVANIQ